MDDGLDVIIVDDDPAICEVASEIIKHFYVWGDVLAFTHADLQCDPYDVKKAYEIYRNSADKMVLVKGNRQGRFSILTSSFHLLAAALFFKRFDDINGQPKIFPAESPDS